MNWKNLEAVKDLENNKEKQIARSAGVAPTNNISAKRDRWNIDILIASSNLIQ